MSAPASRHPIINELQGISIGGLPDAVNNVLKYDSITNTLRWTKEAGLLKAIIKTVDQTVINSIIPVDDNELFVELEANKQYMFNLYLSVSSTTFADIREAMGIPGEATGEWCEQFNANIPYIDINIEQVQSMTAGTNRSQYLHGSVKTESEPGRLQFKWAQGAADVTGTTMRKGTTMLVWEA